MSIRNWISKAFQRFNYTALSLPTPNGIPPSYDKQRAIKYHNRSWVYVCSSRNAETISGVPLRLYVKGATRDYYSRRVLDSYEVKSLSARTTKAMEGDDVEEITGGHPLLDLLDYVNGEHTRAELFENTVNYLELTGDAYWYMVPGPAGVPVEIWPLMSQYTRVVRDSQGALIGYLYGRDYNNRVALAASEVLHFRYPNPEDPDYGLSPLQATFGAVTLLEAQQEYMRTMYEAGGMPQVGIVVKGRVSDDEKKALYAEWQSRFASRRRGEKAIVLEGDIADLKTWGYPPNETGLDFTQKFSREEVCAAYGVPMTMVQLSEASRAGAEAGQWSYMQFTIAPKLLKLEQKINEGLCAKFDSRLFVAFDNPIPEDKAYELQRIDTMSRNGVMTVNEIRGEQGLEPVEWGEHQEPVAPPQDGQQTDEQEDQPEGEQPKGFKGVSEPLTAQELSFQGELVGYIEGFARDMDERLKHAGR